MTTQIKLEAAVFSGLGQGAYFTGLDWVRWQCQEKFGFVPYPGTLNLRADADALAALRRTAERHGIEIVPPTPDFCPAHALRVTVEGEDAAVVLPQAWEFAAETHGADVIEVIAPVALKEKLKLKDGDKVVLSYRQEAV